MRAPAQQAQQLQVLGVGAVQAAHLLDRGRQPGRGHIQQRRQRGQRVCQRHMIAALLRHMQRFVQRKRRLLHTAAQSSVLQLEFREQLSSHVYFTARLGTT